MHIWAIADLHLSFGTPNKKMDLFGAHWKDCEKKIEQHWRASITSDDLVLIAGDISWAMNEAQVKPDLDWIDQLPGTKCLIKGNHDYWWGSLSKVKALLPPSCHAIQHDAFHWKGFSIGGTRLWDDPQLCFKEVIAWNDGDKKSAKEEEEATREENKKIYQRELHRLEMSLKSLDPAAQKKIVMTHYPPIGAFLEESQTSRLLEKYGVDIALFGHLHNVKPGMKLFGEHQGTTYYLTACDYLENFAPLKIL